MSATAIAVLLGVLVAFMVKSRWVRASGAIVCVLFGLVLVRVSSWPRCGLGDRGRGRLVVDDVAADVRP